MKHVPDRKKLRRVYVWKKRKADATIWAANTFKDVVILASVVVTGYIGSMATNHYGPVALLWTVALISLLSGFAVSAWISRSGKQAQRLLKALPVVPPFTPDTLPADEILARGSDKPPGVHSEVLLRAATGPETPKEELLRVSQE